MHLRALWLIVLLMPVPGMAQFVVEDREHLAFDRPEAWAMAYLGSATLFTGLGAPQRRAPGDWGLGVELSQVPHVSTARRRVGFNGSKLEDLNKSPVFGRARVWMGLPGAFSLELGWSPSLAINGARSHAMQGLALERVLFERGPWHAGGRVYAHRGSVRGDFTCDRTTAAQPPGSSANPYGCRAPSRDRFSLHHYGLQASLARSVLAGRGEAFVGLARTRLEARTRVDAEVFSVHDRSLLTARGNVTTLSIGASRRLGAGFELLGEAAWTPLDVRRPPNFASQRDDLWHARMQLRWSAAP